MMERIIGNYLYRISPTNVDFSDFINPWNLYSIFFKSQSEINQWLFEHGLFRNVVVCEACKVPCKLQVREKRCYVRRCTRNINHEIGLIL